MTEEYKQYLKGEKWAEIRNDIYFVRGKKCERCGSEKNVQVHHKHYRNIFHEEPEDLEILCNGCHLNEHGLLKITVKKEKPNLTPRKGTKADSRKRQHDNWKRRYEAWKIRCPKEFEKAKKKWKKERKEKKLKKKLAKEKIANASYRSHTLGGKLKITNPRKWNPK